MINLKPFRETPGLCGPASLKMIMDYYGVFVSEAEIARVAGATRGKGTSAKGLAKAAKHFGFKTSLKENSALMDLEYFVNKKIPVIVDWFSEDDGHYSVVVDIDGRNITLMDPQLRKILIFIRRRVMPLKTFFRVWFDFPGNYIKRPNDLVLRRMIVITPQKR